MPVITKSGGVVEKRTALISGICIGLLSTAAHADWSTYQGNAAHTGYVPVYLSSSVPSLLWSTPLSSSSFNGLAVGDHTVFVTNSGYFNNADTLHALDQANGSVLWSKGYVNNDSTSAPAYVNGTVYLQTDGHSGIAGNFLHAYSARTGASVFDAPYSAQWETYLNPTPYQGNVYTGGGYYGGIYSFNASSGAQNFFGYVGQYDGWTPAVDDQYCYVFTGSGDTVPIYGQFRIINRATGATTYLITDTGFEWSGYTMNSAVVLGSQHDAFSTNGPGSVYPQYSSAGRLIKWALQADATHTPHIAWELDDHYLGQPTLANGVLYVNDGGILVALDELTGQKLWTWTPPTGSISGTMIAADNLLFVGAGAKTYAIDLASHTYDWAYPAAGVMALSDDTLYIAAGDSSVYALSVPEPTSLTLAGAGLLIAVRRRRS